MTKYQKSREDRVFDPVKQIYRDSKQESQRAQYEKDFLVKTLNNARVRSLRYGQTYDIINHRPYTSVPSSRKLCNSATEDCFFLFATKRCEIAIIVVSLLV